MGNLSFSSMNYALKANALSSPHQPTGSIENGRVSANDDGHTTIPGTAQFRFFPSSGFFICFHLVAQVLMSYLMFQCLSETI